METDLKETIDFDTMRVNCIQIHQEVYELHKVAEKIGITIDVLPADELRSDEKTKTWDGMRRYAKELYENKTLWEKLPKKSIIEMTYVTKTWDKQKARIELLDCYHRLQGK